MFLWISSRVVPEPAWIAASGDQVDAVHGVGREEPVRTPVDLDVVRDRDRRRSAERGTPASTPWIA
jgi:hypothetical protein